LLTDNNHNTLQGKMVFFATGNIHKFNEARVVLAQNGIAAGMLREKAVEIQSDSLKEIASASAQEVWLRCHLPVIVEDAGLFVDALKGFPGPYAAYVYKTLGNRGLLKQMENVSNRRAKFQSAIAYCDAEHPEPSCFEGEVYGEITLEERKGKHAESFGFDPVFKPDGSAKTFAEMPISKKNRFSHRATAIQRFADWYKEQAKSVL
jgi:XTP/dITP diphosphohydrolase